MTQFYTMQLADPQLGMINCCGPQEGPSKSGAVGRARLRVYAGGLLPPLAAPRRDPRETAMTVGDLLELPDPRPTDATELVPWGPEAEVPNASVFAPTRPMYYYFSIPCQDAC